MNKLLSPFLCGYRKGYSTQFGMMTLIEKWINISGYAGVVLMKLSKSFHTINHGVLIAKLHTYGFSKDSLEIILS